MNNSSSDRQKYFEERAKYNDRIGSKVYIKNRQIDEVRKLELEQEIKQEGIIRSNHRKKGILLNVVGGEQKNERDLLRIKHVDELAQLKVEPFPEFEQWQQQRRKVQNFSDKNGKLENSKNRQANTLCQLTEQVGRRKYL